jgi:hypothetical protein
MAIWHLSLCLSTSEDGQWQDEGSLWLPSQFCGIPGQRPLSAHCYSIKFRNLI